MGKSIFYNATEDISDIKYVENMDDLLSYTIKELQQALQEHQCKHLSGAKRVLVNRLWKVMHPSSIKNEKLEYLEWDKNEINPRRWETIWVVRNGQVGHIVKYSDVLKHKHPLLLLKVDFSHSPPIVFSETHKEYIIEGVFNKSKQTVRFGETPSHIQTTKQYINDAPTKSIE